MSGLLGIHQRANSGSAAKWRSEPVFDAQDAVNAESTAPRYLYSPHLRCAAKGLCARADTMSLSQESPTYTISLLATGIRPQDIS